MNNFTIPPLSRSDTPIPPTPPAPAKRRRSWLWLLIIAGLVLFIYFEMGLYTVQPIGALPEGVTVVVWRQGREPFFNSPDAMCLLIQNRVSLLCRGVAMGQAPTDRIILRLPYQEWAYLASTGGKSFAR